MTNCLITQNVFSSIFLSIFIKSFIAQIEQNTNLQQSSTRHTFHKKLDLIKKNLGAMCNGLHRPICAAAILEFKQGLGDRALAGTASANTPSSYFIQARNVSGSFNHATRALLIPKWPLHG